MSEEKEYSAEIDHFEEPVDEETPATAKDKAAHNKARRTLLANDLRRKRHVPPQDFVIRSPAEQAAYLNESLEVPGFTFTKAHIARIPGNLVKVNKMKNPRFDRANKKTARNLMPAVYPPSTQLHDMEYLKGCAEAEKIKHMEGLPQVIRQIVPDWSNTLKATGHEICCPALIIISHSSKRTKDLFALSRGSVSATKFCVLADGTKDYASNKQAIEDGLHQGNILVTTPFRLQKLIDDGLVSLDRCENLFIDAHRDSKARTIFEYPETKQHLMDLLEKSLINKLALKKIKISFL